MPDVRRVVVRAGHHGDVTTARAHLRNQDPLVRVAAMGALQRCGDLQPTDLINAAADSDAGVRVRAAELAAAQGGGFGQVLGTEANETEGGEPEALTTEVLERVLLGLLEDPDERVCEVAAFALGEVPLSGAPEEREAGIPLRVRALTEVAADHDASLCREAAVAALGALGHPAGLPAVLHACRDRAQIRRRAVLALVAFDDPQASRMLEELSSDRDLQVSQAATDLLAIEAGEAI